MAAVALPTAGISLRSDDLPGEDTKRSPDDHNEVRFFQDGLNTGARILGK
jgi:hypothetical protein